MTALVLSQSEVRQLLPMQECMELMEEVLRVLAKGQALNPLRWAMRLPAGRLLGLMPGYLEEPQTLGLKVVAIYPENHGTRFDSHQGIVTLFDAEHGFPVAIMDASEVTAIRTAAVSGVATRSLARPEASDLAILGSGVQARTHLEAMALVRDLRRVRVYSPNEGRRRAFAERESGRQGVVVEPVSCAREAVEGADLICTTTAAREPVIEGDWIAAGAHVNAVGACLPSTRELDTSAVVRARLFVDRRESAAKESGDYLIPLQEGAIDEDHILAELGEVLAGEAAGRRTEKEITLFDSLGIAVEDLAVANYVYGRAKREGVGTSVDLGGLVN